MELLLKLITTKPFDYWHSLTHAAKHQSLCICSKCNVLRKTNRVKSLWDIRAQNRARKSSSMMGQYSAVSQPNQYQGLVYCFALFCCCEKCFPCVTSCLPQAFNTLPLKSWRSGPGDFTVYKKRSKSALTWHNNCLEWKLPDFHSTWLSIPGLR